MQGTVLRGAPEQHEIFTGRSEVFEAEAAAQMWEGEEIKDGARTGEPQHGAGKFGLHSQGEPVSGEMTQRDLLYSPSPDQPWGLEWTGSTSPQGTELAKQGSLKFQPSK